VSGFTAGWSSNHLAPAGRSGTLSHRHPTEKGLSNLLFRHALRIMIPSRHFTFQGKSETDNAFISASEAQRMRLSLRLMRIRYQQAGSGGSARPLAWAFGDIALYSGQRSESSEATSPFASAEQTVACEL